MNLTDITRKTVWMPMPIWDMAKIPTEAANQVGQHVRKLHAEWQ
jgi:hypothetical protein